MIKEDTFYRSLVISQFEVVLLSFTFRDKPHRTLTVGWFRVHVAHVVAAVLVRGFLGRDGERVGSRGTAAQGAVGEEGAVDVPCSVTARGRTVDAVQLGGCRHRRDGCLVLLHRAAALQHTHLVAVRYRTPGRTAKHQLPMLRVNKLQSGMSYWLNPNLRFVLCHV